MCEFGTHGEQSEGVCSVARRDGPRHLQPVTYDWLVDHERPFQVADTNFYHRANHYRLVSNGPGRLALPLDLSCS